MGSDTHIGEIALVLIIANLQGTKDAFGRL
jgi:hypothetical protein